MGRKGFAKTERQEWCPAIQENIYTMQSDASLDGVHLHYTALDQQAQASINEPS